MFGLASIAAVSTIADAIENKRVEVTMTLLLVVVVVNVIIEMIDRKNNFIVFLTRIPSVLCLVVVVFVSVLVLWNVSFVVVFFDLWMSVCVDDCLFQR